MTLTNPTPEPMTAAETAEAYASLGWRVIPIAPGHKYPKGFPEWQRHATDDLNIIRSWYTGLYKDHGVGIVTGQESGIWVLDIDIANGKPGDDNLQQLIAEYGTLDATPEAETGTGGGHIFFAWNTAHPITNGHATRLPAGLDIRGEGGFVVAAPSIHPCGQEYRWINGCSPWDLPLAEAPEWLYELLCPPATEPAPATYTPLPTPTVRENSDSIADWVRANHHWADILEGDGWTIHSHHGPDTWWTRPGKSTRDGHSAVLHGSDGPLVVFTTEIPPSLAASGKPTADGSGISLSLFNYLAGTRYGGDRSALARDQRQQLNRIGDTWLTTAAPAAKAAPHTPNQTPSADTDAPNADASPHPQTGSTDGANQEDSADGCPDGTPTNRHTLRLLTETELAHIPPPQPLADGWFYRRTLAVLYGPAKKGKTFVAVDLALSVATGQNWLCGPVEPGNVIYCLGEGVAGLNRRLQAWRTHHNNNTPAQLAILPHVPQLHNPIDVHDFIDAITPHRPDLIIIDTLARATVGVEENSSKDMGEVVHQLDRIKEATGACVLVLHHTGKDSTRGTRGSSALTGAIDTGIEVRGDPRAMTLVVTEQKDAEPAEPRQFRCEPAGESIVMIPTVDLSQASTATIAVMDALVEIDTGAVPTSRWKDMAVERGIAERTFYRAVKWLVDNRQVVNVGTVTTPKYTVNGSSLSAIEEE